MDEMNVHYNDLLYFCEVRWLSRGAMLSRMCDLQQEIATLIRQKNLPHADHFSDPRWLTRLALLTDITAHLNALNVKLLGKEILVTDMHTHITAFQVKLRLWEAQLAIGQFVHFLLLVPLTTWTWTLASRCRHTSTFLSIFFINFQRIVNFCRCLSSQIPHSRRCHVCRL